MPDGGGVWGENGEKMGEETKLKGCNTDEVEPSSLEEKKDTAEEIPLGKMAPLCTSN